jgi:simple sugar transport system substrate-binding protein
MSRAIAAIAVVAAALLLAACGDTTTVREPDVVLSGDAIATSTPTPSGTRIRRLRLATARVAVVSHGQASDPFWAVVKRGIDSAARETGVAPSYRAPDTYDIDRMKRFIDEAIDDRLDGLVVSLPDVEALAPAIRRAVSTGIPVISINSGSDRFRELGISAHVGQPEWRAGFESGRRMGEAGVRNALCVNQESGNAGLRLRCRGFAAGLRRSGGRSREVHVDVQDPDQAQRRIANAVTTGGAVDGLITLGPGGAAPALEALRAGGLDDRVRLATFDLSPDVLEAVRDGQMLFAVDQQPYLQGYLPIVLLAERTRHLLFPADGELIPTGPRFVTRANAQRVIDLSRRGFR